MEASTQQHLVRLRDAMEALQRGEFLQQLPTTGEGMTTELAEIAVAYNSTIQMLNTMAYEFTRIERELGTEGKFGGQALVAGAQGTWADLRDNLNTMSASLTDQVRDLNHTTRGAGRGDAPRPLTCPCRGEMRDLFDSVSALTTAVNSGQSKL